MIKNILLALAVLVNLVSFTQLSIDMDSVHQTYDTTEDDVVVHNFHSTSTPIDSIVWKLHSVDVPSNWLNDAFICDAVSCKDESVDFFGYNLIDAKLYTLDVHFLNNNNTGEGTVKLLIWDYNDSLNTAQFVTFHTVIELSSSIETSESIDISIYPNPVTDFVQINNIDLEKISSIEVFNIIGKKVLQVNSLLLNNTLNFSDFDKGVYFIKMIGINENTYYTKNIIKN